MTYCQTTIGKAAIKIIVTQLSQVTYYHLIFWCTKWLKFENIIYILV